MHICYDIWQNVFMSQPRKNEGILLLAFLSIHPSVLLLVHPSCFFILYLKYLYLSKPEKLKSEYIQEIPQSHTADQPKVPPERAT